MTWRPSITGRTAFHLTNIGLAFVAFLGTRSQLLGWFGLMLGVAALMVWGATGIANRARFHSFLGENWVEAEVGMYGSLAFWTGVLVAAAEPGAAEEMPVYGVATTLVTVGMVGMLSYLLPLTSLLKDLRH